MKRLKKLSLLSLIGFVICPQFALSWEMPSFTKDVPFLIRSQISNDFQTMQQIEGNSASVLHKKLFGNVRGENYLDFFSERINSIGFSFCNESPHELACATGFFNIFQRMWVTPNFINSKLSLAERIGIYIHEARHTETIHLNWKHVNCLTRNKTDSNGYQFGGEEFSNDAACDESYNSAYGIQVTMMKNISKFCANCTNKVKIDAALQAGEYFTRIIHLPSRYILISDLPNQVP